MRRAAKHIFVVAVATSIVVLYSPTILYGARLLGFELARPQVDDQRLEMGSWWITVASPGGTTHAVLNKSGTPQVVFVKANGWWPGFSERLVVSKAKGPVPDHVLKDGAVIRRDWGEVLVLPKEPSDVYEHAFSLPSGLLLTSTSRDGFEEIRRIYAASE